MFAAARTSSLAALRGMGHGQGLRAPAVLTAQRLFASEGGSQGGGNPLSMFEQFGRETLTKAQEAAQKLGEATSAQHYVDQLQNFTQSNAEQIGKSAVPLFSAMLILARSPGTSLSEEQQAKLAESLPPPALDVLKSFMEIVPEDPQVVQLKRIADSLEKLEAKLDKMPSEQAASGHGESPP
eukprot:TRINITY_DN3859_c0_g1_i1.p1 TRINITY_DN3859_c0_g1~~TRINITY_DN3859_c0_g1_i1.p1  ORF type:complete len:182 (+),score=50.78 TRINITY_DN3859_c0_g1_i1:90-635(+)